MASDGEGGFGALSATAPMPAAGSLFLGRGSAGFAVLGDGVAGRDRGIAGVLAFAWAGAEPGEFGVLGGDLGLEASDRCVLGGEERFQVGDASPKEVKSRRGRE